MTGFLRIAIVAAVVVAVVAVVIAATGGGGGFALAAAGGEIISGAAVADAAMTTAVAAGATGASLMFASRAGKKFEEDYYSNHYKSHNQAENGQFKEAVRRLKDNYDMNLTQDQQQRLHYAIRHKGYSLEEIIEEALNMFGE